MRKARIPADPEHNIRLALQQWVEKGVAPDKVIATKFANQAGTPSIKMTRPLCPYPQAAKYKGTGDSNDASNFECAKGNE